jgi:hypothetical protein
MGETHIPKMIPESNITGNRSVGKPRKSWVNAMEIGNREVFKVINLERESLDR